MTEDYTFHIDDTLKYYGKVRWGKINRIGVEIPIIFTMIQNTKRSSSAQTFKKVITSCIESIKGYAKSDKIHPNWVVSAHIGL